MKTFYNVVKSDLSTLFGQQIIGYYKFVVQRKRVQLWKIASDRGMHAYSKQRLTELFTSDVMYKV